MTYHGILAPNAKHRSAVPNLSKQNRSFPGRREADSWGARRNKALQENQDRHPEAWAELTGRSPMTTLREIIHRYIRVLRRIRGKDLELLARSVRIADPDCRFRTLLR